MSPYFRIERPWIEIDFELRCKSKEKSILNRFYNFFFIWLSVRRRLDYRLASNSDFRKSVVLISPSHLVLISSKTISELVLLRLTDGWCADQEKLQNLINAAKMCPSYNFEWKKMKVYKVIMALEGPSLCFLQ